MAKKMDLLLNSETVKEYANEYFALRKQKSVTEARMKELGTLLKKYAVDKGTKNSTGSSYCDLDKYTLGNQVKKTIKLNQEKAKTFLLSLGLYERVVETKETINEDKLEQLVCENLITLEDIESIVDIKESYAIDIKEVKLEEDIPEVQVANQTKVRKLPKKLNK